MSVTFHGIAKHRKTLLLLAAVAALTPSSVNAHAVGENYVWLNIDSNRVTGRFEFSVEDLDSKLGLQLKGMESADLQLSNDAVQEYVDQHFRILSGSTPIALKITRSQAFQAESEYIQYYFESDEFEVPEKLGIENDMFFKDDRFHRSLLLTEYNKKTQEEYGAAFIAMIFSPTTTQQVFDLMNVEAALGPRDFIWQGMLHIWIGIDHILFLVVLLLPAVLERKEGRWQPVDSFRKAIWNVLKIVTVFTIAHSITLSLAALEIVQLPSRIVESTIALSIILVAVNVLFPKFKEGSLMVIFFFGLFHGLGFASVMGHIPFRVSEVVKVLLGFNVGVEVGQIAIVAALFPLIYLLRNKKVYQPVILKGGTILIALVASYWFVERAFAL